MIGAEIKRLRIEAGMSPKQLASKLGLTVTGLGKIERENYDGHGMATLRRIAVAFGKKLVVSFADPD